jgi:hypothetical protein
VSDCAPSKIVQPDAQKTRENQILSIPCISWEYCSERTSVRIPNDLYFTREKKRKKKRSLTFFFFFFLLYTRTPNVMFTSAHRIHPAINLLEAHFLNTPLTQTHELRRHNLIIANEITTTTSPRRSSNDTNRRYTTASTCGVPGMYNKLNNCTSVWVDVGSAIAVVVISSLRDWQRPENSRPVFPKI